MTAQEIWLANLKSLVDMEARLAHGEMRDGLRAVSAKSGLSEEYLYQLYTGKPKADGSVRAPGLKAVRAIVDAYGKGLPSDWFDHRLWLEQQGDLPGTGRISRQSQAERAVALFNAGISREDLNLLRAVKLVMSEAEQLQLLAKADELRQKVRAEAEALQQEPMLEVGHNPSPPESNT